MSLLPACMFVQHVCAQCLWRPEEDIGSPGTVVTNECEPSHGCWEANPGPLQEQSGL